MHFDTALTSLLFQVIDGLQRSVPMLGAFAVLIVLKSRHTEGVMQQFRASSVLFLREHVPLRWQLCDLIILQPGEAMQERAGGFSHKFRRENAVRIVRAIPEHD